MNPGSPPQDNSLHRLLVVDDEEIVLVALRETLRREGYQVDTTTNALQGLEMVRKEQYSAIITDQMMPNMNGRDLLHAGHDAAPDQYLMKDVVARFGEHAFDNKIVRRGRAGLRDW